MKRIKQIADNVHSKVYEAAIFYGLILSAIPSKIVAQANIDEGARGGVNRAQGTDQPADLFSGDGIFQTVTNFLLFLIGVVSVIMLIIGGFQYVISGGDSTKVEKAKNTILYAIIGLVVAILAFAAVDFVLDTLGI